MAATTYHLPMKRDRSTCGTGSIADRGVAATAEVISANPQSDKSRTRMNNSSQARVAGLRSHKPMMRHHPLAAVRISEQFRARHPEHAPALEPEVRAIAISGSKHAHYRAFPLVLIGQPMIGAALIMRTVDQPATFDFLPTLEVQQRVDRRHESAREEMPAQPVA